MWVVISFHILFASLPSFHGPSTITLFLNTWKTSSLNFHHFVLVIFTTLSRQTHTWKWKSATKILCYVTTHSPGITLQSMQFGLSSLLVRKKSIWLECWAMLKVIKWDFFLSKKGVLYHEVVSYSEVQDFFSLLILFVISKTPMYPLKPPLAVPTWLLRFSPIKSFSLLITPLYMSFKYFQNRLLTSSLKPTCGPYTLMTFKIKF
jgi:hypothetical protein